MIFLRNKNYLGRLTKKKFLYPSTTNFDRDLQKTICEMPKYYLGISQIDFWIPIFFWV